MGIHDEDIDREIDLLIRVSDITGSMQVVREAIASLVVCGVRSLVD